MRLLTRIGPRLAAAFALVALLSIGVSSVIVYRTTATDMRDRLRQSTVARMEAAANIYATSRILVPGVQLRDDALPRPLQDAASEDRVVSYFDGTTMWAAKRYRKDGTLSVRQSTEVDREFLDRLVRLFLIAGAVAALVATLAGALIAHRAATRLARISRVAGEAASGRFNDRVADPGRDQVGDLARAVDTMTENLGRLWERERRFSADVAHELRTPVAALVAATELLDDERGRQIAREQVVRLRRLVDDLIETFRAEHSAQTLDVEPVDLAATLATVLDAIDPPVEVKLVDPAWVEAEPRRLARVLDNLVSNALKYGVAPVEVTVNGPSVEVRDNGGGFPEWLIAEGPQRFRTASTSRGDGVGLGLTIARTLATSMGATLELSNHPDGGAVARLTFPGVTAPLTA